MEESLRRLGINVFGGILAALTTFVAVAPAASALDLADWRAYAAVEEVWVRDRHYLLVHDAPSLASIADMDLDRTLADLQRRGMRFHFLIQHNPGVLSAGCWLLPDLAVTPEQQTQMLHEQPAYRKLEDRIRRMTSAVEAHAHYRAYRRAQIRLSKTPAYLEAHRRYLGRMQELQQTFFARK